jgi:hypothetical protein
MIRLIRIVGLMLMGAGALLLLAWVIEPRCSRRCRWSAPIDGIGPMGTLGGRGARQVSAG